jgi:hypothetical protein
MAPAAPAPTSAIDPLSTPYALPSRGLYYGPSLPGGVVRIAPTRGAQEEALAGVSGAAQENEGFALLALKNITEQCISMGQLALDDMLFLDWTASLINFFAISAGSDEMRVQQRHAVCRQMGKYSIKLSDMPCKALRFADPGEAVTWPPLRPDVDDEDDAPSHNGHARETVVPHDRSGEPFVTEPLPLSGVRVSWRYHRMRDLTMAHEYAERMQDKATPAARRHTLLQAVQIVAIDGRPVGLIEAATWVRGTPSPDLNELRQEINDREFGYDLAPTVKCLHCGGLTKVRIPLRGGVFRRAARR